MGALDALVRIFGETGRDDAVERGWRERLHRRHTRRLVLENRAKEARARFALERRPARQHLEQQRAEREDVCARVGLEPFDLLGRHVLKRAEDGALRRHVRRGSGRHRQARCRHDGRGGLREPEVEQLGGRRG